MADAVKKTVVVATLEMADILAVEEICLDGDADAALRFVRERLKPQIDAAQKAGCDAQLHLRGGDMPAKARGAIVGGHAQPATETAQDGTAGGASDEAGFPPAGDGDREGPF